MLNPCGVEKSQPIMPISTSAELGSVPARDSGRMSMLTKGSSTMVGEEWGGGEGLDRRSTKGSDTGASSMHSERGVVDMLIDCMMGDGVQRLAVGVTF